tara:strand:+ start:1570 stop:3057 length:1488 start_codon:yes stop_codon:yes gene_type:complete
MPGERRERERTRKPFERLYDDKNPFLGGVLGKTVTDSITAGTTQTQAGATALTTEINRVTVSAVNGDGVKLPSAEAGYEVLVINDDSAQTIQIWPNTGDKIDSGAANAADTNSLAAGASRRYIAVDQTSWYTATTTVSAAGGVLKTDFNANTILAADTDDTPAALTVAEQTVVGRITAGNITDLTATQVRTLINVENGATADQSDAEIKTAYENNADTNAYTDSEKTVVGNTSGTNSGDEAAASLTVAGVVELATGAETNTGTDATRAVTPDGLDDWTGSAQVTTLGTIGAGVWSGTIILEALLENQSGTNTGDESSATTSAEGIVERSTSAENVTGTDDTVYPTVAGAKEIVDTHGASVTKGSWTPVFAGSSTAGTQTYTRQVGRYTKIDNLIMCGFDCILSAFDGATSGNMFMTGLPFTVENVGFIRYGAAFAEVRNINIDTGGGYSFITGGAVENTTTMQIFEAGDAINRAAITHADFAATSALIGVVMYRV